MVTGLTSPKSSCTQPFTGVVSVLSAFASMASVLSRPSVICPTVVLYLYIRFGLIVTVADCLARVTSTGRFTAISRTANQVFPRSEVAIIRTALALMLRFSNLSSGSLPV